MSSNKKSAWRQVFLNEVEVQNHFFSFPLLLLLFFFHFLFLFNSMYQYTDFLNLISNFWYFIKLQLISFITTIQWILYVYNTLYYNLCILFITYILLNFNAGGYSLGYSLKQSWCLCRGRYSYLNKEFHSKPI